MTILAAVGTGIVVLLAGSLPWGGLAALNLRAGVALPWAVLPMALWLWLYWQYLGGGWRNREGGARRRELLRANRLPARVWAAALSAGLLGFGALLALLATVARLVDLPASSPIAMPPEMPVATVIVLLAMQSVVAGTTEEAAFRGYMQGPIERRHGLGAAILVSGLVFGLLHFPNHPSDVLLMLPYYVAVSAVYGGLTWAVDSILPALVLHVGGDIIALTRWWATGKPEWQLSATPRPLVWEHGIDLSFVLGAAAFVALAALSARVYRALRARVQRAPAAA